MATETFTYGVASGDPLADRVILWTHVTGAGPGPVRVRWRVALDEWLTHVVRSGDATAEPDRDHTVHVDATGLTPGTTYWYGFEVAGEHSPIGRTRTLPTGDVASARFAVTSCAKFNAGYFNAYERIADRARRGDLDFLLHLGDYIYEASNTPPANQTPGADIGRPFAPLHECVTLDDYRTRYRQYGADPSVQRLRASLPILASVDDHELADGAWRGGADNHDEAAFGPWDDRKAAAFRAREEWMPIRRPDPDDATRVFRSVPLGDLADLLLTDSRSRRDLPIPAPAMYDEGRTALGAEQREWFLSSLSGSTAAWRLWGNPSVLSPTYHPDLPAELVPALQKLKLVTPDGLNYDHDQWDGYPAERDAILGLVEAEGIDDLVVLSGDIHVGLACEVHCDPYAAAPDAEPLAAELVTASVTSQNLDDKLGYGYGGSQDLQDRFVEAFPHARWTDFDGHGYLLVDLDRARLEAQWWFVDDVLAPSDHEFCPAAFQVHRGSSRLHPVPAPTVRTRPRTDAAIPG
jgi:alkaline phosphatase D